MYIASANIKQNIDTVRAVEKNNGLPLYSEKNNSLKNSKNFFVPSSISNGTSGAMIANGYSQYAGDLNANCPFVITNNIRCSSKHCLVYRPI